MLLKNDTRAAVAPPHSAEECVEIPLLLLDGELAELVQRARSAQASVGQMIRQAIGVYIARARDRCDAVDMWGDSQPDASSDEAEALTVTLLLPSSRLVELEALSAQQLITTRTLIRHVVCFSIIGFSPIQSPLDRF
jgi:hypothetical protein